MNFPLLWRVFSLKVRQSDEIFITLAHSRLLVSVESTTFALLKYLMMDEIIGRETEIKQLSEYVDSDQPEFIAIYGRRRVGKTFLVTRLFQDRLAFDMTGVLNGDKADQMGSFMLSLKAAGYDGSKPKNWAEAFEILKVLLEKKLRQGRTIVFIDELPCLDTPRSGLVKALDLFWNGWGNRQNNLKL